jgi:predicted acetyltransferase
MDATYIELLMGYSYSTTNTNDVHWSDCIMTLYLLPVTDGLILYIMLLMTTATTTTTTTTMSTLHILGKVLG